MSISVIVLLALLAVPCILVQIRWYRLPKDMRKEMIKAHNQHEPYNEKK